MPSWDSAEFLYLRVSRESRGRHLHWSERQMLLHTRRSASLPLAADRGDAAIRSLQPTCASPEWHPASSCCYDGSNAMREEPMPDHTITRRTALGATAAAAATLAATPAAAQPSA